MGRIAKILSFTRAVIDGIQSTDVKVDPGGGPNITGVHSSDPGDDSSPLAIDYAITQSIQGTGKEAVVGYVDTKNAPLSLPGEKRIYGRDSNGNVVNEIHLKATGEININRGASSVVIDPAGKITTGNASGSVVVEPSGKITMGNAAGSVVVEPTGAITIVATSENVIIGSGAGAIAVSPTGSITIGGVAGAITVSPAGAILLESLAVKLGGVAGKPIVISDFINSVFNLHTHPAPGTPPSILGTPAHMTTKTGAE